MRIIFIIKVILVL